ncbi:hypothetical protein D0C36_20985 [Mucilaginibacter conchicola]|uniref:HNH domain-containing protein n=1 Tax=Mucilaginibacter conchicola TaxID=2303333 RepID=A0A372NPI0_9SPHI|nr:HNH endonuclease [Mucilaginibacter conchicola]RFZ90275.1 hypothetical protein D0C36_20985 [Mucilaginibacter conchicola]
MKNLKPYNANDFEFYDSVLSAKDSDDLRLRLSPVSGVIKAAFDIYATHFRDNGLASLVPGPTFILHKRDLISLYNYNSSAISRLRNEIERLQPQQLRTTCQYCTLTSNESMDHYVPKDEFPEYAVNPLNLFPSCSKCNQHKSFVWRNNEKRTTLNLYTDQLPDDQYLFVEVKLDEYSELEFEFYLENSGRIDDDVFSLIESHFKSLKLLKRMREKSIPLISELRNTICSRLKNLPYAVIKEEIRETAEANRLDFGRNYWKSVVELELIECPYFIRLLKIS